MVLKLPSKRPIGDFTQTDLLNKIISMNPGKIVPIVSNSFRINQIFCDETRLADFFADTSELDEQALTIEEQLTQVWAEKVRYPLADTHNLARVSHYYQIRSKDSEIAKKEYVDFLKSYLLEITPEDENHRELIDQLTAEVHTLSFSEIVRKLKYPKFPEGIEDPLSQLAQLPFPIYITTSYFDFLERVLIKVGNKNPRTQIIHWSDSRFSEPPETIPDPTVGEPIVYHLFGLESDPASLVMSEDDYLKFLVTAVSDTNKLTPTVPLRLQRALAQSHLLLLGYQLDEWDFRVLFRFILNYRVIKPGKLGIFIQVKPKQGDPDLLDYLSRYFGIEDFEIEWKTPERFIQDLWKAWSRRER
jgi:hypothetical protein